MSDNMPGDRFLPHPDVEWYDRRIGSSGGDLTYPELYEATPGQRRSYLRYILAGHRGERAWEIRDLAEWKPQWLAPWNDAVTTFDDAALEHLWGVEGRDFWFVARGASDAAVDALADRVGAGPLPGRAEPGFLAGVYRIELLAGADTDRALARLADLARADPAVAVIAEGHGIWVPPQGPGVRRYVSQPRLIVADQDDPEPGLRIDPPIGEYVDDPRGVRCAWPLSVVLDVDLSLVGLTAPGERRHPFIGSLCEECEADEEMADWRGWSTVGGKLVFDEEREDGCPGNDPDMAGWPLPARVGLAHDDRFEPDRAWRRPTRLGRLGGLPVFQQNPHWPGCCGKPMVFVGQTSQSVLGGFDEYLYGFACECGAGAQVGQNT